MTAADAPFGIYVHVPFCASRCGYCAFNTFAVSVAERPDAFDSYIDAAIREVARARQRIGERVVTSVYFGGGTPTLLPSRQLVALLGEIQSRFACASDVEISVEANPESVSYDSLTELRINGFTRISFGVQSASPAVLAALERAHTPGVAAAAVGFAREAGFEHINTDLIYGTPIETDDDWVNSIEAVLALPVDHVSAYALAIEPRTRLAVKVKGRRMARPDDDAMAARYEILDDRLAAAGFTWYELSNWARSEAGRCRHNLGYWRGADWWGIGPGAHSHLAGRRWANVDSPAEYAAALATGREIERDVEVLDSSERWAEAVMTRMRLVEGCRLEVLVGGLGSDRDAKAIARRVERLLSEGLVRRVERDDGDRVVLTRSGRRLADFVVREILTV